MSRVVVLRGPVGVGKSTIAKIIQDKLGPNWVVLDVDKFKHYMTLKDGEANRSERSKIAHDVSRYFAKQLHEKGYDIILEEMYKREYNNSLVTFLRENNMQYVKVFLSAPVEDVVQRADQRTKNVPELEVRAHYQEIVPYDDDYTIDTTKFSSEEIADKIITLIK